MTAAVHPTSTITHVLSWTPIEGSEAGSGYWFLQTFDAFDAYQPPAEADKLGVDTNPRDIPRMGTLVHARLGRPVALEPATERQRGQLRIEHDHPVYLVRPAAAG